MNNRYYKYTKRQPMTSKRSYATMTSPSFEVTKLQLGGLILTGDFSGLRDKESTTSSAFISLITSKLLPFNLALVENGLTVHMLEFESPDMNLFKSMPA